MQETIYTPSTYWSRPNSRSVQRELSNVLSEKFQYYGGRTERVKVQGEVIKRVDVENNYKKTVNILFETSNEAYSFDKLAMFIPNIDALNPYILAIAIFVINDLELDEESLLDENFKDRFFQAMNGLWFKVQDLFSGNSANMVKQSTDVYQYIVLYFHSNKF